LLKRIFILAVAISMLFAFSAKAEAARTMSDKELASYVSGQIDSVLNDSGLQTKRVCNSEGCVVVVQ